MIFVNSFPVLFAILVIATNSSVAEEGCPPGNRPCGIAYTADGAEKCLTIQHRPDVHPVAIGTLLELNGVSYSIFTCRIRV
ncbi:hypothetical protein KEM48_008553 [Puccinia striiformis f. sp. tritici PST-130]|nr:hypothetical protein H4Q26_008739 [Puccinia striiformis f. sp. tritici PST-130]KAI9625153.1 hypothetical protein KEM48_008553 [Puccinia striiformis f. sp. tritici PST-130]